MDTRAAQAMIRFGLGRRGQEPLPDDPASWLARQLDGPDPALAVPGTSTAEGLTAWRDDRKMPSPDGKNLRTREVLKSDFAAVIDNWLTTETPFRERLAWFWVNHFTISMRRGEVTPVVGAFVREAIRPHVNGRFGDMLLAVMQHPAMLIYLDNQSSIGPASRANRDGKRGLNENLARESLELHTVSPASGYTQADVTEYAKILTGWSFEMNADPPGYLFRPNAHEPGPKTLMGRSFPPGQEGGVAALAFLADHPATHLHLATKLVRHFVADDPPPDAVRRVRDVLVATHGDLRAASLELIALPQAWAPLTKLRSPADYVVAVMRALDLPADKRPDLVGVMGGLGQPFMDAPLPNGYPDTAADWAAPEALLRRVDWAYGISGRPNLPDPASLAQASLGPLLPAATFEEVRRAGSRRDALTLLLASPEFNRR